MNAKRFALVVTGTMLALALLVVALRVLLGVDLANGGLTMIPPMLGAMVEGQKHAKASRAPIEKPWALAVQMTGITLAINLVFGAIVFFLVPGFDVVITYPWLITAFVCVVALVWLLVTRYFIGFGAKQTWKAMDQGEDS